MTTERRLAGRSSTPRSGFPIHIGIYAATALVVVGAAVWLSFVSDDLAVEMGWQKSFIGHAVPGRRDVPA